MDFDFNRVQQYAQPIRLVFGYIRSIHKHTPDLISFTVLAFYLVAEHFERRSKREVKFCDDHSTIRKKKTGWKNTTYGKVKVLSKDGGSIRWKIKINRYRCTCIIGIDEGRKNVRDTFWDSTKSTHYAWEAITGNICGTLPGCSSTNKCSECKKFSTPFRKGDTVVVELDMDRSRLRFGINTNKMRTAFRKIKTTEIGYSLAVHLFDRRDSVSLVSTKFGRPNTMRKSRVITDPFD